MMNCSSAALLLTVLAPVRRLQWLAMLEHVGLLATKQLSFWGAKIVFKWSEENRTATAVYADGRC